jgi:hypothetical protein
MKILECIPVTIRPEPPAEGVLYLENDDDHQTLASKIAMLKDYDADYFVFHHTDLKIETPELIQPQCERMKIDNVGIGGLIGTLCLFDSCTWWNPQRNVVTVGAILQGDGKGGSYPMLDGPGYRADAVSVDGCFLILSREFVQKYEPHDFGSWRYLYDVDACLQCLQMGLNVGIVDIRCTHDSQGHMTPDFEQTKQQFLAYWKQHVTFPVIKQSEFK